MQSQVFDPSFAPGGPNWSDTLVLPQTVRRPEKLKNMNYTQFWQLVTEDRIAKVCLQASECCSLAAHQSVKPDVHVLGLWGNL